MRGHFEAPPGRIGLKHIFFGVNEGPKTIYQLSIPHIAIWISDTDFFICYAWPYLMFSGRSFCLTYLSRSFNWSIFIKNWIFCQGSSILQSKILSDIPLIKWWYKNSFHMKQSVLRSIDKRHWEVWLNSLEQRKLLTKILFQVMLNENLNTSRYLLLI